MYQIQIGDNYYNINGVEAAWNAFQIACEFVETCGGVNDVYLLDLNEAEGQSNIIASSEDL